VKFFLKTEDVSKAPPPDATRCASCAAQCVQTAFNGAEQCVRSDHALLMMYRYKTYAKFSPHLTAISTAAGQVTPPPPHPKTKTLRIYTIHVDDLFGFKNGEFHRKVPSLQV